jgi:drug/metabolite transporter (DMT)-like permease
MQASRPDVLVGIYAKVAAMMLFAVMDALAKWLGGAYPTMQLMLFRNVVSFLPLFVMIWWAGGWHSVRTRQPGLQAIRVLLGLGSLFVFFWALPRMNFVEVYAIAYAAPIMMTALSVPLLGEQVGWRRWAAVALGFAGVLVILDPWGGEFGWPSVAVAGGTLCYALSMICIRRLARTDGDNATMFSFAVVATALSAGLCLADPGTHWREPAGTDLVALAGLGVIGGIAQILVTRSLRLAPPSVLAPFEYTSIVFAFGIGYVVFAETIPLSVLLGVPLVIGSGLYILHRERTRTRTALP